MHRLVSVGLVALVALVVFGGLAGLLRPPAVALPHEEQLAASGLLYRVAESQQPVPALVRIDRVIFDRDAVTVFYQTRKPLASLTAAPDNHASVRPLQRPIDQLYVGDGWRVKTVPFAPTEPVDELELIFALSGGVEVRYSLPYPQRPLRDNTARFDFVVPRHQVTSVAVGVHWIEIEAESFLAPGHLQLAADSCGLEGAQEPESLTHQGESFAYRFTAPPVPRLVVDVDVGLLDEAGERETRPRLVTIRCGI